MARIPIVVQRGRHRGLLRKRALGRPQVPESDCPESKNPEDEDEVPKVDVHVRSSIDSEVLEGEEDDYQPDNVDEECAQKTCRKNGDES